ncbi:MAG TPA: hypothetical protein VHN82_06560 [Methanoregula sp.]|nr:hypothetical protein [Methanoregula sp.]
MDLSSGRRIVTFILVLLCAILVSNALSNIVMAALGITGISGFIIGFVLYAVFFFSGCCTSLSGFLGLRYSGLGGGEEGRILEVVASRVRDFWEINIPVRIYHVSTSIHALFFSAA